MTDSLYDDVYAAASKSIADAIDKEILEQVKRDIEMKKKSDKENQVHGWLSNLPERNLRALSSQHGVVAWDKKARKHLVRELETKSGVQDVAMEMIKGGIATEVRSK